MSSNDFSHTSVLLDKAINGLAVQQDGFYIDGTFGRGGHSRQILAALGAQGRLLAIDRDPDAVTAAAAITDERFSIVHGSFSALNEYADKRGWQGKVNGVLLDLGVSSPQLDDPSRGFSFLRDGPLDMRMDNSQGLSAAQWLQSAGEADIAWVLKTFGEERFARRIASAIVRRNQDQPMTRTSELAALVAAVVPVKERSKHPATRTFQAVRIWLNRELEQVERGLAAASNVLAPGGRLVVISFHSLEDRIVKRFIRDHSRAPQLPARLPLNEAQIHQLGGRTLKSIGKWFPDEQEVSENSRARSSVLRIAEKQCHNVKK